VDKILDSIPFRPQAKIKVHMSKRLPTHADGDGDKILTEDEALSDVELFVESQVTYFGQIYEMQNLRNEVFQMSLSSR
jgi:hypothetical protein